MSGTAPSAGEATGKEARPGLHSILFAAIYEPSLWLGERAGMAARRRALVAEADGEVLELGAGTGLNLEHYPAGLERLVLAEPDAAMAARLRRRLERSGRGGEVAHAAAESLPFADDSFDTVVSTLVLCTVEDPVIALGEVRRVLRPGGRLLFIEHVRADGERLARWQDRLHGPWRSVFCGCNCNRATLESIRAAGFETTALERGRWRGAPVLVRPLVVGRADPRTTTEE